MSRLLSRLGGWAREVRPSRRFWRRDLLAGLPGAVSSVPDGMASAVLAGVNPVYGLYASFAGPAAGGLFTSTRLMVVTTTSAGALAAGSAIAGIEGEDRPEALFLLTTLVGVCCVVASALRLGRYLRFVSHSVMLGFLTGVAVNIIAGQLPDLAGVKAAGSSAIAKAFNVLAHPTTVKLSALLIGLAALAILLLLARTRLASISALVALVVPTGIMLVAGLRGVARVQDTGEIPQGIPLPHLPDLSLLSVDLIVGAVAVTAIVLVQGAGVSEAAPNPDGAPSKANRDFLAQGVANVASGLFRGQPVGGSVGQTALNVSAGAQTRWGAIWSGCWMLVILVLFSGVVGQVATPTLAAVLIFAAVRSLRPGELLTILRTGWVSKIVVVTTFLATLFLPIAIAVGFGVVLSLLLQLNQEAIDLAVVRVERRDDGRWVEHPAPAVLPSDKVMVLDVYGSLFYAGARTLQARLPDPAGTHNPVVVLRLRGRTSLGATFFAVTTDYATKLAAVGGRLYLSGISRDLVESFRRTRHVDTSGPIRMYEATEVVGDSTTAASKDAEAWLIRHHNDDLGS